MAEYTKPIARLIGALSRLPGIGRKSAQRLAYFIITAKPEFAEELAEAIKSARETVHYCSVCHDLTDSDPCDICASPKREREIICVVQESKDVLAIERTHEYNGLYHVLGGAISPMDGIGAEELSINELIARLTPEVKEVILATSLSVEGETTAMYLARLIKPIGIAVSRIAKGIPAGSELEFADEATLAGALEGRKPL